MRSLVLLVLLGAAIPASAQDQPAKPATADTPSIDATKLGVSLSRIQRGLKIAESREQRKDDGLRIEFNIHVFGNAPRIDVIPEGENLLL